MVIGLGLTVLWLIPAGCSPEREALRATKQRLAVVEAERHRLERKLGEAYRMVSKLETEVAQLQMEAGRSRRLTNVPRAGASGARSQR
jgi:hypothetical protein